MGCHSIARLPPAFHQVSLTIRRYPFILQSHPAGVYASFHGIKLPVVMLLPPGWDAIPLQDYLQHFIRLPWQFAATNLYPWAKKSTVRIKRPIQEFHLISRTIILRRPIARIPIIARALVSIDSVIVISRQYLKKFKFSMRLIEHWLMYFLQPYLRRSKKVQIQHAFYWTLTDVFFAALPTAFGIYPLNQQTRGKDISARKAPKGYLSSVNIVSGPYGRAGGAFYLKGTSDSYIDFPNSARGKLDAYSSISIFLWVFPEGTSGPIINYRRGGYGVGLWMTRSKLLVGLIYSRRNFYRRKIYFYNFYPKRWYYVGLTYDYNHGIASLWVNGKMVRWVIFKKTEMISKP